MELFQITRVYYGWEIDQMFVVYLVEEVSHDGVVYYAGRVSYL